VAIIEAKCPLSLFGNDTQASSRGESQQRHRFELLVVGEPEEITCAVCSEDIPCGEMHEHRRLYCPSIKSRCNVCGKCFESRESYRHHMARERAEASMTGFIDAFKMATDQRTTAYDAEIDAVDSAWLQVIRGLEICTISDKL
jgi:hypothetical protein